MARLNHIAIAVSDLDKMKRLFAILGLEVDHSEAVPEQKVVTHFIPMRADAGLAIELLTPDSSHGDGEGPVAQFLQKKGPGIHHFSVSVNKGELDAICRQLQESGFKLIYEQPRKGAHGMRINFVHPASAGGVLIEISEQG